MSKVPIGILAMVNPARMGAATATVSKPWECVDTGWRNVLRAEVWRSPVARGCVALYLPFDMQGPDASRRWIVAIAYKSGHNDEYSPYGMSEDDVESGA